METDRLKFGRALEVCLGHADALQDALNDLGDKHFSAADLLVLSSHERRLQDDMGERLFPALLGALGEEVTAMSVIDRLNRLEQLGWIPLADEWLELRRIRNEFAHDYPENPDLHLVRLRKAMGAGRRLVEILEAIAKGKQNA
ncbi:MAG: hypothetical protein KUA37_13465 [Desulfomicrobium sp.]|nr:hypothetical protein [Pseudomonadota bacterium]MBV1712993.1 hypothetical protein [Desulfomicrobium sp.]MBU4571963.1 hypothetical protein [Pseudomonadota bacterium]MBU4596112.1 hypothetical protein [Pseudomonadota bacterium]MBV1721416.1 hypothetical protein [Desulfomicrobium sp.]